MSFKLLNRHYIGIAGFDNGEPYWDFWCTHWTEYARREGAPRPLCHTEIDDNGKTVERDSCIVGEWFEESLLSDILHGTEEGYSVGAWPIVWRFDRLASMELLVQPAPDTLSDYDPVIKRITKPVPEGWNL